MDPLQAAAYTKSLTELIISHARARYIFAYPDGTFDVIISNKFEKKPKSVRHYGIPGYQVVRYAKLIVYPSAKDAFWTVLLSSESNVGRGLRREYKDNEDAAAVYDLWELVRTEVSKIYGKLQVGAVCDGQAELRQNPLQDELMNLSI